MGQARRVESNRTPEGHIEALDILPVSETGVD